MSKDLDRDQIWTDFEKAVNMTPSSLEKWLKTDDSHSNGWKEDDEDETIGHRSGRRILDIKRKTKTELTDADYRHMPKVVGYIHRHKMQGGPHADKEHSPWRYSLMNWGHDPLKSK